MYYCVNSKILTFCSFDLDLKEKKGFKSAYFHDFEFNPQLVEPFEHIYLIEVGVNVTSSQLPYILCGLDLPAIGGWAFDTLDKMKVNCDITLVREFQKPETVSQEVT